MFFMWNKCFKDIISFEVTNTMMRSAHKSSLKQNDLPLSSLGSLHLDYNETSKLVTTDKTPMLVECGCGRPKFL